MTSPISELELEALHPACFGWAMGCCNWDRAEAEDVLQTVYLKVLDRRARFHGRSSLKTWLYAVIRHTAAARRRRRWWGQLLSERLLQSQPPPDAAPDAQTLASESQTSARLRAALRALPERQRDTLHLVFYEDLTVEEAAVVLGVSIGSARTHYHRGKARLRTLLERPA